MVKGPKDGGKSCLNFTQKRLYKIELSRWPFHLNKSLKSVGPEFSIRGNPIRVGKKLEIAYGYITIGNDKITV